MLGTRPPPPGQGAPSSAAVTFLLGELQGFIQSSETLAPKMDAKDTFSSKGNARPHSPGQVRDGMHDRGVCRFRRGDPDLPRARRSRWSLRLGTRFYFAKGSKK